MQNGGWRLSGRLGVEREKRTLDASAMLALIQNEPGSEDDDSELFVSSVNLCEVASKLVRDGRNEEQVLIALDPFLGYVANFDSSQAIQAAALLKATQSLGLSLGDRACLALALRQRATAVTTDRAWKKLKIGIQIELLR